MRLMNVYIDFTESGSPIIAGRLFDSEKTALGNLVIDGFWTLDHSIKTNFVVHTPRKKVFRNDETWLWDSKQPFFTFHK